MRYLCIICAEKVMETMTPAEAEKHFREYEALFAKLRKSGHLVSANRLMPASTAKTVRVRKKRVTIKDGPFAETKEQFGGYFIIEAADTDEAIGIASQIPGAKIGCVEVRPIADDERTVAALDGISN
jgi:hypothetical protein